MIKFETVIMQLFILDALSIYVRQMNLLPFLLHLPDGSLDVTRGNPLTCVRHENIAQESTRNLKMTFVFIDILSAFLVNSHVLIDYQVQVLTIKLHNNNDKKVHFDYDNHYHLVHE